MVFARFVLLAAVLLAASSVSAAVTIDLGPSDYRRWGSGTFHHHTNGLNAKFGQTVRMPPMNTNLVVTRNPVVPYGSIVNGAKNFVRINPASVAASAAITALFLGLDWVFDEELDSWMKEGEGEIYEDPNFVLYQGGYNQIVITGPTAEIACQRFYAVAGGSTPFSHVDLSNDGTVGRCRPSNTRTVNLVAECPPNLVFDPTIGACRGEAGLVPLSEADWLQLQNKLPTENPDRVGNAANDIMLRQGAPLPGFTDTQIEGPSSVTGPETTTSTTTETGDNIVTTTQTTTNISYGDTTITTTNTSVTNTYTNGNHTSTETTTETPGELPVTEPSGGGAEWPGFCDWATVVCDFIDWFQEPFDAPEVEWPLIEDQDFEEEFDFTLAASCPEPYTIELALFPPVQFNWQPFCDLATFIRPLVLASAAIFAAFISLGIARART